MAGYARFDREWLDDLYVDARTRRAPASARRCSTWSRPSGPSGFCLWVFESNEPARGFYRHHGLVELERTDGAGNEEREPDVRMAWPGQDPLAFYRGLIDDVDAQLGDLLNRRAALTRAVQHHKGTTERDPAREREIARALAARAPLLGEDRPPGSCTRSSPRAWLRSPAPSSDPVASPGPPTTWGHSTDPPAGSETVGGACHHRPAAVVG